MDQTKYNYRFLARIVMEAETPLAISSGEKDIRTDLLVALDVNGLPYIPGTTIAGIIRHMMSDEEASLFFGFQASGDSSQGKGSKIIFTEAKMIGEEGKVMDGLQNVMATATRSNFSGEEGKVMDGLQKTEGEFYAHFKELPIRQHVRINEKGVAIKNGKFDQQVVYKGTRFCFEIEMVSAKTADDTVEESDLRLFQYVLSQIRSSIFRIGSNTRSGLGKMKMESVQTKLLDLKKDTDRKLYLGKSACLSDGSFPWEDSDKEGLDANNWTKYELILTPQDFFLFGSGFGDDDADITPVKESIIKWNDNKPAFVENCILIPASSIKGALSHRTAYHWNKLEGRFADKPETNPKVGKENPAIEALFGSEGEKGNGETINQKRGSVIFSDLIEEYACQDKILNHIAIDRFTGGTIDGALFSEKTTYVKGQEFRITIEVYTKAFEGKNAQNAFEAALKDICTGMLPLGGGVNRGNGVFEGTLRRNKEVIYSSNRK